MSNVERRSTAGSEPFGAPKNGSNIRTERCLASVTWMKVEDLFNIILVEGRQTQTKFLHKNSAEV